MIIYTIIEENETLTYLPKKYEMFITIEEHVLLAV